MNRVDLLPHPDTPCAVIERLCVEVDLTESGLGLTYLLTGNLDALAIPALALRTRREGLWRHTCCEAFLMADAGPGYREFNFSPSGDWQAYAFGAYRVGGLLEPVVRPRIEVAREYHRLTLHVALATAMLPAGSALRIGLSAVIETLDGALAYWALRHAPGKPDFHQPDTFALELA